MTASASLLGFIIGIWAGNFEQLQLILLLITPLVFLGGSFTLSRCYPDLADDHRSTWSSI
jgi:ABC-2 type transport system permease protein